MTDGRQQNDSQCDGDPITRLAKDAHVSQRDRLEEVSKRLDTAALVIARLIGQQIAAEKLNQKSAEEH